MKKNIHSGTGRVLFFMMLLIMAGAPARAQQKDGSRPEIRRLSPSPGAGYQFRGASNFGKSIAVFGGSLSVNRESDAAKQIWADMLGAEVTTYGVGGAGFSCLQGYSVQRQVEEAGLHDIYVLWASTNDFTNDRPCGEWTDYTVFDGYDESKRETQCGGINWCIRKIFEKNPKATVYFFTPLRFFRNDSGHNPSSEVTNGTGLSFAGYIEAQKQCCGYYGIPVLDQFSIQGVNEFNCGLYYLEDKLHLNEDGYSLIGGRQAAFLAQ